MTEDLSKQFEQEVQSNIQRLASDDELSKLSLDWMLKSHEVGKYSYNFRWLGRPIIQQPQDMVAVQELIWSVRPDLVIETGIAHGGSLILSASILAMLDLSDAQMIDKTSKKIDLRRKVIGVDIDIRSHNRKEIESHPLSGWIQLIEGSSTDSRIVDLIKDIAKSYQKIMVFLDSNHSHDHVLKELYAYAHLVSNGSYCVVFDTIVDDMPCHEFAHGRWGVNDNPKTAVKQFLSNTSSFVVDKMIEKKLQITVAPDGYLKKIK